MKELTYSDLAPEQRELLEGASDAMDTAYCPYSGFFVGAALRAEDGSIVTGSNVENAAYSATICAERSALVRANAEGKRRFSAVAVIARGQQPTTIITGPCGACRQMLYEAAQLSGGDFAVILSTTDKSRIVVTSVRELLPLAFGPQDLGVDMQKYQ